MTQIRSCIGSKYAQWRGPHGNPNQIYGISCPSSFFLCVICLQKSTGTLSVPRGLLWASASRDIFRHRCVSTSMTRMGEGALPGNFPMVSAWRTDLPVFTVPVKSANQPASHTVQVTPADKRTHLKTFPSNYGHWADWGHQVQNKIGGHIPFLDLELLL